MLAGVIERPGFEIDRIPLFFAHSRVRGADVLGVIFVKIRVHRHAIFPQRLMVLRTGQRRQAEELDDVERKFFLHDGDIAPDRLGRVRGKAQDITGERDDALRLPGEQHLAIFGDFVLTLLRCRKIVRIDVFQADEDPRDPGPFGLLDKVRNFVAQRVDLDHQSKRDSSVLAQRDQAVEDRFPIFVARKVIVGDEEFVDALRPVEAHQMLHVIGGTVARLAALHVDDRAERALVRTAAAGVETRAQPERARDMPLRQERHGRALHPRQVLHKVVDRRKLASGGVLQHRFEPALGLAGKHGDAQIPAGVEIDRTPVKHRQASRHMKASHDDGNPGVPERPRDIESAGILIRLDADEPNQDRNRRGIVSGQGVPARPLWCWSRQSP